MRVSLIALCLFFVSCLSPTNKITYSSPQSLNNITKSVVKISTLYTVEDKLTLAPVFKSYVATGFSVKNIEGNKSFIITNQHVCSMKQNSAYLLTLQTGERVTAKYIRVDAFADICLLEADAVIPPLKISEENASYGDRVITIGGPEGVYPVIVDGFVSGYYDIEMKNEPDEEGQFEIHFRAQVISAPTYPGSSGSPVFDTNGIVVGIVFAGLIDKDHITYMVPVNEVLRFLDRTKHVRY